MMGERFNIHATAIVAGTTGVLFIGPSGSGKSSLAFAFLAGASNRGLFSALIADDRVLVSCHGGQTLAECPASIAGLMELRNSGIVTVKHMPAAVLHYAVMAVSDITAERLPPENDVFPLACGGVLPLLRIPLTSHEPFAKFTALADNLLPTALS
jgi:serine kinase of HPr protein (carbohydrate metabolism regulator)